jgi:hypothetical protein
MTTMLPHRVELPRADGGASWRARRGATRPPYPTPMGRCPPARRGIVPGERLCRRQPLDVCWVSGRNGGFCIKKRSGPDSIACVTTPALQHRDTVDQQRILPCCHCCCCPAATAASPLLLPGRLALPPLLSLHSSSDLSDVGLHAGCPVPVVSASGCSCRRRLLRWRAEYRGQGLVPRHRRRHQTGR